MKWHVVHHKPIVLGNSVSIQYKTLVKWHVAIARKPNSFSTNSVSIQYKTLVKHVAKF